MTSPDVIQKIEEIAESVEGKVRDSYSGRGMYGDTCYGISTKDPDRCIELAKEQGITGERMDNMGLGTIVYWPHIQGRPIR